VPARKSLMAKGRISALRLLCGFKERPADPALLIKTGLRAHTGAQSEARDGAARVGFRSPVVLPGVAQYRVFATTTAARHVLSRTNC